MVSRRIPLALSLVGSLAAIFGATSDALACTQEAGVSRQLALITATDVPKRAGLVFRRGEGDAPPAVEVRSGDTILPGTFTRTGGPTSPTQPYQFWHWQPDAGELPVGTLTVRTSDSSSEQPESNVSVTDRVLDLPDLPPPTVKAIRSIWAEPNAPTISCKPNESVPHSTCTARPETLKIAIRNRAVPLIVFEVTRPPEANAAFFQERIAFHGRNADGSPTDERRDIGRGGLYLESGSAQFCIELASRSLVDGTEIKRETCIPNTLVLTVDGDENEAIVEQSLQSCESGSTSFPPGTSAEDPTGNGTSGCSMARSGPTGGPWMGVAGLAFALTAIRRRAARAAR